MKTATYAASLDTIREASDRIAPYAHRTPVMTSQTINDMVGCSVSFKCENLQKVGAFKFRGACNAIMKLDEATANRGVVTHSSGNHAQAIALAAKLRGISAHIVMPTNASPVKRRAVEGYGATVVPCEPKLALREDTAAKVAEKTDGEIIPPYNHPDIIAGQGTAALELCEQVADLDVIVAPIGGGGLMSGTCIAAHSLNPKIRIIGAEPKGADDAAQSLNAGRFIPQTNPNTIADGLLTSLGDLTWPIIRDHVERIITVSDEEIVIAMRLVWERMKLVIEPSAAVAVAAVLSPEFETWSRQLAVGVILSGGNANLDALPDGFMASRSV